MNKLKRYLTTFLICVTAFVTKGQNIETLKQFLTVENGLSHNEVTSIIQDNDGFIWIGTRGGLNRYDGYEFKVFNQVPEDDNSLVNPSIETLFIDSKGNIWIGTKSGGVSKYNPVTGQFSNIINNYKQSNEILPVNRVLNIYEDLNGKIWIGTWAKGLYIYDEKSQTAKRYLKGRRISSIVGTNDNRIFVGATSPGGIFEYKEDQDTFELVSDIKARKILYDEPRNVLWIVGGDNVGAGTDKNGLTKLDLRNSKITSYFIDEDETEEQRLPHSFYALHLDKTGQIWVGTWGTGLYIFNPGRGEFERTYIYPENIGSSNRDYDAVLDIFEDKHNNIWLGTNGGGVCVLSQKMGFNSVGYSATQNTGLSNTRVMSILEDSNSNLWLGTIGNGLFWSTDRIQFMPVENPYLVNQERFFVIKYLYEDLRGKIWVGTNIGTYFIEFNKGKPSMVKADVYYDNKPFNRTAVSFLDTEAIFYMGTLTRGLILFSKKNYTIEKQITMGNNPGGRLKNNRISYLFQDSRERIWLGTYDGLHVLNPKDTSVHLAEEFFEVKGNFTGNIITCIDEDQKGNIWIGTPNGLNKFSQNAAGIFEVKYFTEGDGLASNFIKGIATDFAGNIWFSTNVGISKYAANENRFLNFNEADGVRGRNFTEASVFKSAAGDLYFGGTHGLTFFNPNEIVEHKLALKPVFTRLDVLNQSVEAGMEYGNKVILNKSITQTDHIKLSYEQNKLEIEFSALDFVSRGTNNYAYYLENGDNQWVNIGKRRFVIFTDLAPGDYVLKVRSSNRQNVWSEEYAELAIQVLPPFWRTWYALLIYIFTAIGLITIIRWNAVKQERLASNLEMERMQHEQDQKLNEMKLRFFTNISHEFRTPLTLILAPVKEILSKTKEYKLTNEFENKLGIIQNNSLRLLRMVNQLLDFRKVESGNMRLFATQTNLEDFVAEVCFTFGELAQINSIQFKNKSSLKTKEVWFDRDKMEIVLNNLISNAFKFVKTDGKIEVALYEEEDEVLISVSDNGPGIPSTELDHIFQRFYQIEKNEGVGSSGIGLALSKRFVEMHGGSISVSSERNVNTEFVVSLPKGKAHLKPEEIVATESTEPVLVKKEQLFKQVIGPKVKPKTHFETNLLVVDDSKEVRDYLANFLGEIYSVQVAENGASAIAKVKESAPDLIVSDVMMPEMDGFEFCKRIRSKENTATIPFVFLTAKNDEQFRLLGTQAGANDYISKPFDPTLLLEKIKNILERHKRLQKQYSKSVRLEPSDIEISSSEEAFIKTIIEVIEKNLHNSQFSSEVLAAEMNRSYSSLYRKLKKLTGLSAAEFIRTIRIKRAGQLLADREKTISEIAYEVGFNDVKHFRTVFQKQFGCSPSKYREKL